MKKIISFIIALIAVCVCSLPAIAAPAEDVSQIAVPYSNIQPYGDAEEEFTISGAQTIIIGEREYEYVLSGDSLVLVPVEEEKAASYPQGDIGDTAKIMWQGMLGIFSVMLLIMLTVTILNKISGAGEKRKEKKAAKKAAKAEKNK